MTRLFFQFLTRVSISYHLALVFTTLFGSSYVLYAQDPVYLDWYRFQQQNNCTIYWDEIRQEVSIEWNSHKIIVSVYSDVISVDESNILIIQCPLRIIDNLLMIRSDLLEQLSLRINFQSSIKPATSKPVAANNAREIDKNREIPQDVDEILSVDIPKTIASANSNTTTYAQVSSQKDAKLKFIYLDAGHGGNDPGCQNLSLSLDEKNIVLKVVLKLGKLLEKKLPSLKIVYTRTTDVKVTLDNVVIKAMNQLSVGPGIFISIHANSAKPPRDTTATGIETYFFSPTPNGQSNDLDKYRFNVVYNRFSRDPNMNSEVKNLVGNLMNFTVGHQSYELASYAHVSLTKALSQHSPDRGIQEYPYQVISFINIPSILVEIGFLSHPTEGQLLNTDSYQDKIAAGLAEGIINYVNNYNNRLLS